MLFTDSSIFLDMTMKQMRKKEKCSADRRASLMSTGSRDKKPGAGKGLWPVFAAAFAGIGNSLKQERNMRIHALSAKDAAAGAVLVFAFASAALGAIIFLPKIWSLFQ
ncbi:Uncharacterised protein [Mycobacteroides abscessus subsp. abscessus]|nr:Uncharacterised protein [Mycobacteroides abscessus subsp. abscessus]